MNLGKFITKVGQELRGDCGMPMKNSNFKKRHKTKRQEMLD
jgi:hypothetical protein